MDACRVRVGMVGVRSLVRMRCRLAPVGGDGWRGGDGSALWSKEESLAVMMGGSGVRTKFGNNPGGVSVRPTAVEQHRLHPEMSDRTSEQGLH